MYIRKTHITFKKQVYNAFGLRRSVLKTWGIRPLVYYAEAKAAGKELPKAHHEIEDDPLQVGTQLPSRLASRL